MPPHAVQARGTFAVGYGCTNAPGGAVGPVAGNPGGVPCASVGNPAGDAWTATGYPCGAACTTPGNIRGSAWAIAGNPGGGACAASGNPCGPASIAPGAPCGRGCPSSASADPHALQNRAPGFPGPCPRGQTSEGAVVAIGPSSVVCTQNFKRTCESDPRRCRCPAAVEHSLEHGSA